MGFNTLCQEALLPELAQLAAAGVNTPESLAAGPRLSRIVDLLNIGGRRRNSPNSFVVDGDKVYLQDVRSGNRLQTF